MACRGVAVTDVAPIAAEVASATPTTRECVIRLLVLGATGRLGRRVADLLTDRPGEVVPVGRAVVPDDVVGDGDVVVNVAATTPDVVVPWATAGSHGGGYLDLAPTEASLAALADAVLGPAPVVAGAGFAGAIGDALAVVAAGSLVGPDRVDVTVYVPSRRSLLAGATPRERSELLAAVTTPMAVLADGEVVTERIAEARRLAWFPRPVGPHHAAATPGPHWRTLPDALPGVRTVRSALALRSSSAEVLQGLGNLSRLGAVEGWVRRRAARPGPDRGTAGERWAVVVEVATAGGDLVRGWAYGHDRHDLTAHVAAVLAPRVGTADASPHGRPVGATAVMPPDELLDELAARTDLRWSVTEPVATG